jgi:hypothetical protein
MKKHLIALVTCLLLVSGCATSVTSDIKIETEAVTTVKFSSYQTYTWLGSAAILYDPNGKWEPPGFDADAEIKFLIDRELRQRGMIEDSINPGLIVVFAAGIDMTAVRKEINSDGKIGALINIPEGALTVALIDSTTGMAVWAGLATADVQQSPDQAVIKKRLDYAVSSMFEKLPE